MHDKLKVTSIVVTHDMNSAYKVADSIAMLYHGKIIAEGTPKEISSTSHPIVNQFINGLAVGPITEAENLVFGHLT
jgi:phospholipid/cholesterol/gamma-HCH transport system ATP-binding protein